MGAIRQEKIVDIEFNTTLNFAKYEHLIDSLECCTKKLEKLVEKTTEIEKHQYRKRGKK